ncbi:MAG: hypothetical protein OXF19_06005 [Hyphomicrobiales bacterium]|nr:hypothetical protein [Hyphomicrobiales bacterium]
MDTETKEKLTEQQHQIEMLRTDVEGNMRIMKAENNEALAKNEAAIGGLLKDNEKLRTDMEKSINAHTTKMMIFLGVAVGIITLIVKFL